MKRLIILLFIIAGWQTSFAQDGYIDLQKDNRIDLLVSLYSKHHNAFTEAQGYRIQILASTMRDKAYKTEGDFKYKYGQHKTYLAFKSPYFKLRVGDFIDKLEAYRFLQQLKSKYPGAFLVAETVNLY